MGAAEGCLKCGNFAHIFYMETVTEEEFLKFHATGVLVRSIQSTVGVGVNCQNESGGVCIGVLEEFHKPGRVHRKIDVQVDAGQDDIASSAIEDHSGAVPVAEMRDLLGFQEARGVDCRPWVDASGGEDIKALGVGKACLLYTSPSPRD